MASSTPNLDLTLPVGGENVSRQIINANNVKIDEAVGAVPSGTDLQSQVTALNNKITNRAFNVYASIASSGDVVNRLKNGWDTLWTNAKTIIGTDSGIYAISGTLDFPANGSNAALGTYYYHGDINLSNKAGTIYMNQYHNAPFYAVLRHTDGTYDSDQLALKSDINDNTKAYYGTLASDMICVHKVGRVCYIVCDVQSWYCGAGEPIRQGSASGTQWIIPTGFRPIANCEIKETLNNKRIIVNTNGEVTCSEALSGINLRFSGCFICA